MAFSQQSFLWLVHLFSLVGGFNFSTGQIGECDPLSLSWSGGQPPFQLLIIPPNGTMANVSIPASAYNKSSGQGSYLMPQLKIREEQQFMLSMSDSTGIFAGGTSSLLSVGASQSGHPCNTTYPDPDFTFSLDADLAQCSPYPITLYPGPVTPALPVRLLVNIPQGQSFAVTLAPDLSSWIANLTAGTPAAFTVLDANNKNGGTEVLRVAKATNNTSCLVSSTTSTMPSSTGTTATSSASATPSASAQHNDITRLAIGISIGGFGVLCIALILFWWYRRHRSRATRPTSFLDFSSSPADADSSYLMIHMPSRPSAAKVRSPVEAQRATSASAYSPTRTTRTTGDEIVIHRDITETRSPLEIPPQYSENLPPIPDRLLHNFTNE